MTSHELELQQSSWSSIMRQPAMSKLLVNYAFLGLSYGIYSNLVYFFLPYLDPINYAWEFGLYYLVFQWVNAFTFPLAGILTDRIGRKSMLELGASITVLGTFILPLATVWWHLLFAAGAQGMGFALLGTAQNCVVADVTRGYRREKGYSLTMSFSMVFSVMGTVVLIIYTYVYENILPGGIFNQLPLLVSAILSLIAAIPMFLIKIPTSPQGTESCSPEPRKDDGLHISRESGTKDHQQLYKPASSIWRNGIVLKMIAFQGIIGFGAGFLVPLFNYYWKDIFGLDKYIIYTIALLGELGIAAGGLAAPWMAKRVTKLGGRVGTTVVCQFASIACAVILAIVAYYLSVLPTGIAFIAAQALLLPAVIAFIARQALMNMVNPLISAVTMDHTPETKRGRVNSLTSFAFTVPNGVSPTLSVPLIASHGYASSASVLVVTYIIGTAMLSTTRRKDRLLVMQSRPLEK